MARIRTIKPEFWLNEDLAFCTESSRLLAIGLLNQSDDEGFFKANPLLLKAAIFPFMEPSMSVHECIIQLEKIGYVELFQGLDGKDYGRVLNFQKHQTISRSTPSKIKDLRTENPPSLSTHGAISEDSTAERKGKEQGKERNREQGTEQGNNHCRVEPDPIPEQTNIAEFTPVPAKPRQLEDAVPRIFEYWAEVMNHPRAKLDNKRKRAITAALKMGYSVNELKSAILGSSRTPHNMGHNDRGEVYDGIHVIFRDADQIDRFIRNETNPPAPMNKANQRLQGNMSAAQEFLEDLG